jgi:hypothetical protein
VDERQVRGLIVGRQFLDRAELLGSDGTEPGRMGAVVLADLAVEMAAKAAVLELEFEEESPSVSPFRVGWDRTARRAYDKRPANPETADARS